MDGAEVGSGSKGSKEYPMDLVDKMTKTVDGLIMPEVFPTEHIRAATSYRALDGDVVIASFPKCGTTWATYIVCNLLYFDQYGPTSTLPAPMDQCPTIELTGIDNLKPGGTHKTHLPFDAKRFNPRAKYIVVMRNPRDACVSYYHHYTLMIPGAHEKPKGFWFPAFAKMFMSKQIWFEDYFGHVLSWLEGPPTAGATEDNILYVTYEGMKAHPREELIRVANFIGGETAERVKDQKIVDEILSRTSLKSMRDALNPSVAKLLQSTKPEEAKAFPNEVEFVRKGQVGDWKNHFTPEISAAFDAWIASKPDHEKVMKLFAA